MAVSSASKTGEPSSGVLEGLEREIKVMDDLDAVEALTFSYMLAFVGPSAIRGDVVLKHNASLQLGT